MRLFTFMTRKSLAGAEFSGPSWSTWRVIARLIDGDAHLLSAADRALACKLTGRSALPEEPPREVYIGCGRRGGKSRFGSLVAVWLAAREYPQLAAGETATIANVAPDRAQAAIDLEYSAGLVEQSDLLRAELVSRNTEALEFKHRTRLEVATASYRTVRGRSMAGAIIDESAFLRSDDSALPDLELARAVRPAMMTLKGLMLVISSPHRKMGLLYDGFKRYYGNNDDSRGLYIQATSRELNPTLDEEDIAQQIEADPEGAKSEYLAQFRDDIGSYLSDELIDAALIPGTPGRRRAALAFVDMSGGRFDAAALAIAHAEDVGTRGPPRLVLDVLLHEPAPHEPNAVTARFAATLKAHGIHEVQGDRFGAEWVVSAFAQQDIKYTPSELSSSDIYMEVLPAFSERRVQLIDHAKLLVELRLLERKPRAGGRGDSVDHPRGAHDDLAIAVCGALWRAGAGGFDADKWRRLAMDTAEFAEWEAPPPPVSVEPHEHVPDAHADCEHCRDMALRHLRTYVTT